METGIIRRVTMPTQHTECLIKLKLEIQKVKNGGVLQMLVVDAVIKIKRKKKKRNAETCFVLVTLNGL